MLDSKYSNCFEEPSPDNLDFRKLDAKLEELSKYNTPHIEVARLMFDTLRETFGDDIIIKCSLVGSVASGAYTEGSDIDGAIYVSDLARDKIPEIKSFQQKLFNYVVSVIGRNKIRSCDFGSNIYTQSEADQGHRTGGGKRIEWS